MEVLYHLSYSPEERLNLAADPSETRDRSVSTNGVGSGRSRPHRAARRSRRARALAAAKKSALASITLWNWPKSSKLTRPNNALHATSARTTTASGTSANASASRSRSARRRADGVVGSLAGASAPAAWASSEQLDQHERDARRGRDRGRPARGSRAPGCRR